jgi:endoglycosylceramidase
MRPSALFLILLLSCGKAPAPAPTWSVSGGFIRDPQGRAVILRGANVSGMQKMPPFFDFHGPADYARMRDAWGMNTVRFVVTWAAIEPQRDMIDDAYIAEVARRVKEASDAGLLVFVDMHQDLYGLGFAGGDGAPAWTCDASHYAAYVPTDPWFFNYLKPDMIACYDAFWSSRDDLQPHLINAWRKLAAALKDIDGFIGFDPLNEPYWGSTEYDVFEEVRLHPFYENVIAAVREAKPSALAFVEPASSRNLGLTSHLPPFTEPDIVYAPHCYDGNAEGGNGFDPSHRDAILQTVKGLRDEASTLSAALVLGEYGGMTNTPGIFDYMDAVYDAAAAQLGGAVYWDYTMNDGYALLAADGGEKPDLYRAVMRPFPARTAGTPLEFSFDDTAQTFTYRWQPDPKVQAGTFVSVPPITWPQGYSVECSGCTAEKVDGGVQATATGSGEASLVLTAMP